LPGQPRQSIFNKPARQTFEMPSDVGRANAESATLEEAINVPVGASPHSRPRAVVLGCGGEELQADEQRFFAEADPAGFILFRRNCGSPDQVRRLVAALRDSVGRAAAPVLVDQEGGRVARLRPPHWRAYPSAAQIAALPNPLAQEAAWCSTRLIADDLERLGISVDCLPVLDVPVADADPVIGDRAYGGDPDRVARLGRAACDGLLEGGVLPVLKHIPGHGRARVDSHYACPVVVSGHDELWHSDFAPFRALAAMPWAMTAHIVYRAIDPAAPATFSRTVIGEVIRGGIGFDGVLISDDLSMHALGGALGGGGLGERVQRALAAGCDLVLHCNGDRDEMEEVAAAAPPLIPEAAARLARGEAMRCRPGEFDREAIEHRFEALLAGVRR
jgi:beta-N-acetylhexosaminidase